MALGAHLTPTTTPFLCQWSVLRIFKAKATQIRRKPKQRWSHRESIRESLTPKATHLPTDLYLLLQYCPPFFNFFNPGHPYSILPSPLQSFTIIFNRILPTSIPSTHIQSSPPSLILFKPVHSYSILSSLLHSL